MSRRLRAILHLDEPEYGLVCIILPALTDANGLVELGYPTGYVVDHGGTESHTAWVQDTVTGGMTRL